MNLRAPLSQLQRIGYSKEFVCTKNQAQAKRYDVLVYNTIQVKNIGNSISYMSLDYAVKTQSCLLCI
jgi:hypothetical protein